MVLVETIAVGVCGTDVEIIEGKYGWAPQGKTRLILGHESLGRVLEPDPAGRLKKGDLVVGIVRRPDPIPCPNCAVGEWDMCRNGQYTERGIKQIDGFMSERWRIESEYAMKLDSSLGLLGVLLEPTTVVAKAWEQVDTIGRRAFWEPRTVLVTGAGPIGLLAALLGVQRGLDVHVLIGLIPVSSLTSCALWVPRTMPVLSPASASSQMSLSNAPGAGPVISGAIQEVATGGIICLTGIGSGDRSTGAVTGDLAAEAVLKNNVVVGSVNANKRHWYKAGEALARADRSWLERLITRRERPENFASALQRSVDDIKVVVQFAEA